MTKRLTGLGALNYMGVEAPQPPNSVQVDRAPTTQDYASFNIGDNWVDTNTLNVWILVNKAARIATWLRFAGVPGGIFTLTGNSGGAVGPDVLSNVNVRGDGIGITIVGTPGSNTLTASLVGGGVPATSFVTGAGASTVSGGTAVPLAGVLNVLGAHNVLTGAAIANTVTVFGTNAIVLGDLVALGAGVPAVTAFTGDINITANGGVAGNFNMPTTLNANVGVIRWGGQPVIHQAGSANNMFVGSNAGNFTVTGINNTVMGTAAGRFLTTGNGNAFYGGVSGDQVTTGAGNSSFGGASLQLGTTVSSNTAIGFQAVQNGNGDFNTALGRQAIASVLTGTQNLALGYLAGSIYAGAESNNVMIANIGVLGESNVMRIGTTGTGAGQVNTTFIGGAVVNFDGVINMPATTSANVGVIRFNNQPVLHEGGSANNIFVGTSAGNFTVTGINNTGVGTIAGRALTTGAANTLIGGAAGALLTTGSENICVGGGTMQLATTAAGSTAIGFQALVQCNGNLNTAVGHLAGGALLTGSNNLLLGFNAGVTYVGAEGSNICLANQGIVGESNTIRIGTQGGGAAQQNKCFVAGIAGVTTTIADAVPVLVSASTGQLGTISSSMRYKENIQEVISTDILDLNPVRFNYKNHPEEIKSYGLIAEDVDKIMPQLVIYDKDGLPDAIKYHELPVLLLNEIKKLNKRILKLEKELKARNNI